MAKFLQRLALVAVLAGGATALAASTAVAGPERPGSRRAPARRTFNLFAGATDLSLEVNRVYCGLTDAGNVCTDVTGSPVLGGGSWPRGTPDQYIFNTGVQLSGVIPANANFAWAGDTVGAWAIDTRGPAEHMQTVTGLYNSLSSDDLAVWPSAAVVNDPSLYHPSLLGRQSISQQDTWVRYWDGAPSLVTGRGHTMGVLVEQRSLAWNFPTGNEDIIYFIFRFTNITARASSGAYAGLSTLGYSAQDIADVGALGDLFQNQSEAAFNVQIPDAGYTVGNVYVAFTADMDVGDATNNYATASLPFSLAVTWKSDWREASWAFPANIFSAPFAAAPGFVGVKYLKSPLNPNTPAPDDEFGMTIFSTYTNPSAANSLFPDPVNIFQGYRYVQGSASPAFGDNNSCQYPASRRLCFLTQAPSDQRTMQSSGPFTLAPGQSEVVVVAYVMAPAMLTNGTFNLGPYIGNTTLLPGVVPAGDRLLNPPGPTQDTLRLIDRAMGWVSHANTGVPLDSQITQNEVVTARGSLLNKAMVAQGVFDNQFLLPFAPESPDFYLVPASNRVTVVWAKSATETSGDPYFAVASNVASGALYDPNFRQFDVEGYRVWRGRSPATMEMLVQYDYKNTVITDFTGAFWNGDYLGHLTGQYRCAPELGAAFNSDGELGTVPNFALGTCPAHSPAGVAGPFQTAPPYVNSHDIPLSTGGPAYPGVVQVPLGGRVQLANGTVLITTADTAVTGGGSGFPALTDTGVPFAYEDNDVRNGYVYHYAVTAFDVNSIASGPTSLSSPMVTKSIIPRNASGQETAGGLSPPVFITPGGATVPSISTMPTIDAATGIFSGPIAQTDLNLGFAAFVPSIISGNGSLDLYFDSVRVGASLAGVAGSYHMRVVSAAGADTLNIPFVQDAFDGQFDYITSFEAAPVDSAQNARFGAGPGFALYGQLEFSVPGTWKTTSHGRGDINATPSRSSFNGPRWWGGSANENTPHPNGGNCAGSPGNCGAPGVLPGPLTAGALPGVATLLHIQSYNTVPNVPMRDLEGVTSYAYRAADMRVHWGANGAVDSVMDVTHGVPVPFNTRLNASWGILNVASFAGSTAALTRDGNNGLLTWSDIFCVAPAVTLINQCGGATQVPAVFQNTAALGPIAAVASTYDGTAALAATGNGFIFYLNGHFFLMQMAALPAAGTVWNARFYTGTVRTGNQNVPGAYSYVSAPRPPVVPGMHIRIDYQGTSFDPTVSSDSAMQRIHTVPDPYYVTNNAEITTNSKILKFVNLPAQAVIRIYSTSGILVNVLTHNDPTGSGEKTWNLRNRNNQFVASGVYFYHVESADGRTRVGRFTVVNYAQ